MADKKRSVIEQYLIDNISIPQYFNAYTIHLKKGLTPMSEQGNAVSVCPFHEDVNPSFKYWRAKKLFVCFGCRKSGDIINLHRLTMQAKTHIPMTRANAVKDLCKLYNIVYKPAKRVKTGTDTEVTIADEQVGETAERTADTKIVVEDISVFDRCRQEMHLDKALKDNRKSFNLNVFLQQNAAIRENKSLSDSDRWAEYAKLDLLTCTAIACTDDKFSDKELSIKDIKDAI